MSRIVPLAVLLFPAVASAAGPVRVAADLPKPRQPQLAAAADGRVAVAFADDETLYCAVSTDGGRTFGVPAKVATLPGLMLGMRRGPRVAFAGDALVVTTIGRRDGDLVAWRSGEGGATWSGPARVNDAGRACREGLHDAAAGPDGTVACVWLDLRNDKTEVWSSDSADGGATWSANRLVYRSPDGSVCECCHPSLAIGPDGSRRVLWRNSLAGERDMYALTSAGDGSAISPAAKLGRQGWKLPACPMDGGDVAAGPGGAWAVWRRDRVCYATDLSGDAGGERRLGRGEQPVVAVTPDGPTFAWLDRRPGDLLVLRPGATEPAKLAERASDPSAIDTADGGVLIAWERSEEDGRTAILVERLTSSNETATP